MYIIYAIHFCSNIGRVLSRSSNQICSSTLSLCFDRRLNMGLTVGWPPLRACEEVASSVGV